MIYPVGAGNAVAAGATGAVVAATAALRCCQGGGRAAKRVPSRGLLRAYCSTFFPCLLSRPSLQQEMVAMSSSGSLLPYKVPRLRDIVACIRCIYLLQGLVVGLLLRLLLQNRPGLWLLLWRVRDATS